jgi:uncharacterized membrane protein YfcA
VPSLRALLLAVLAASGALFGTWVVWFERRRARQGGGGAGTNAPDAPGSAAPTAPPPPRNAALVGVGFLTDFLDTLGIGSFAPTTSLYRLFRLVPDHLIPGTLLVGHALPTVVQAIIYITVIQVDTTTLVLLIGASVLGAWLGAGVVAGWPKRAVQIGMGSALLAASAIMLAGMLKLLPAGGDLIALSGGKLAIGLVGNFVLGALMQIGIGAYAPSLILFGLLGMNVKAIFPIMMGSCAFIMPAGGLQFVRLGRYAPRPALGLTLGGVPGVLLAAFVVRELPLQTLRWLVLAVVVYTALAMLRTGLSAPATARTTEPKP